MFDGRMHWEYIYIVIKLLRYPGICSLVALFPQSLVPCL
jgi:hypothetical protein